MGIKKYLNSTLKIMPAIQAKQIADLLQDLQVSGAVRNQDEYKQKLQELSLIVNSSNPKPSFEQIRALVWNLTSSDAHNIMMKSFKNDIEAAFLQVDEIGNKINEHNDLLLKNMIADLERGLAEQENTILALEWLANQANEFTQVLANSFTSSSLLQVARSDFGADSFYFDNRTYKKQNQTQLPSAVVSENGERLILAVTNDPKRLPVGVTLSSDNYSYNTEIEVDTDNNINNVIDGIGNTFWYKNVLLKATVPKVTTVMEFDLGSGYDIGYVNIEGSTQEPFYVEDITGISPGGNRISLDTSEHIVNGRIRIDFERVFVSSVQITFAVYTCHTANYWVTKESVVHKALDPVNRFNRLLRRDSLAPLSRRALASDNLANMCNVPDAPGKQMNAYRYTFALDNVWFGNGKYQDTGIFVSKPLSVTNAGVIAVYADEETSSDVDKNTIEYEIIKIDKFPKYKETRFPILKIDESSTQITERLIFTKRETQTVVNDVGMLRFCPYIPSDWVIGDNAPITIYKNGAALTINTDWEFAVAAKTGINESFEWESSFADGITFSTYTLSPAKMWIKVKNVELNDIYTVIYAPRISDYNENVAGTNEQATVYLDQDRTVFLNKNGRVHFTRKDADVTVESDIYLQITLRRNKASQATSPVLYEYALLATNYN